MCSIFGLQIKIYASFLPCFPPLPKLLWPRNTLLIINLNSLYGCANSLDNPRAPFSFVVAYWQTFHRACPRHYLSMITNNIKSSRKLKLVNKILKPTKWEMVSHVLSLWLVHAQVEQQPHWLHFQGILKWGIALNFNMVLHGCNII